MPLHCSCSVTEKLCDLPGVSGKGCMNGLNVVNYFNDLWSEQLDGRSLHPGFAAGN
jgi:hypothetical protein